MDCQFLGAAQTVTGSKYLLSNGLKNILIDCGLYQGIKKLRLRNWQSLPIAANKIDVILLTHAHIDHSGYIPRLVKEGFNGVIICSEATYELCKILLLDSAHIQEEDAARANRYHYAKHHPALPLYNKDDVTAALKLFKPVDFGKSYHIGDELSFSLHRAGHILGASMIKLVEGSGSSVLFSGDLGRQHDPIMNPPAKIQQADTLILESTYGDSTHSSQDPLNALAETIDRTFSRGGVLLIPAFAVGRAQLLLYYLYQLKRQKRLSDDVAIYVDSPMAIDASILMYRYANEHRLSAKQCQEIFKIAKYCRRVEQSKAIYTDPTPNKIILSASGMASGGRILHHLKQYMGSSRNTILLVGFQAPGTRGESIANHQKQIKIHGEMWDLKAEVVQLDNLSAHTDADDTIEWLSHFNPIPRQIFLTHGELNKQLALKELITRHYDCNVIIPDYLDKYSL